MKTPHNLSFVSMESSQSKTQTNVAFSMKLSLTHKLEVKRTKERKENMDGMSKDTFMYLIDKLRVG